jgi:hypothetical protein
MHDAFNHFPFLPLWFMMYSPSVRSILSFLILFTLAYAGPKKIPISHAGRKNSPISHAGRRSSPIDNRKGIPIFPPLVAEGAPSIPSQIGAHPPSHSKSKIGVAYFVQHLDHAKPKQGNFKQLFYYNYEHWAGPGSPVGCYIKRNKQQADNLAADHSLYTWRKCGGRLYRVSDQYRSSWNDC